MIELIEGKGVGAGKSYLAIERLMFHWLRGGSAFVSDSVHVKWEACKQYASRYKRLVLEDSQYRVIEAGHLPTLHEVTAAGSAEMPVLIVLDEAQGAFNARDWNDKTKRPFFDWLCQSRHDDNDLIILTQAAANVDKQIRRLVTYYWVVRNSQYFPVAGIPLSYFLQLLTLGMWNGKCFVRTQLDQDGRTKLDRKWAVADARLFACYESKSMRLAHRRAGEAIARLKLRQVERTNIYDALRNTVAAYRGDFRRVQKFCYAFGRS